MCFVFEFWVHCNWRWLYHTCYNTAEVAMPCAWPSIWSKACAAQTANWAEPISKQQIEPSRHYFTMTCKWHRNEEAISSGWSQAISLRSRQGVFSMAEYQTGTTILISSREQPTGFNNRYIMMLTRALPPQQAVSTQQTLVWWSGTGTHEAPNA